MPDANLTCLDEILSVMPPDEVINIRGYWFRAGELLAVVKQAQAYRALNRDYSHAE